jgi:uncharacterized membrane protein YkvA (DUF1232 family)
MVLQVVLGFVAVASVLWLVFVVTLLVVRPDTSVLRASLRLLPDVARLCARLARDPKVPRGVRVRLWLLLGYLALPIDLVPDIIPVLGHADDVIVAALVLRSVIRRAGPAVVHRHWPGTPDGLAIVGRLCGMGTTLTAPSPQCRRARP